MAARSPVGRSNTMPLPIERGGLLDQMEPKFTAMKYGLQDTLHHLILPRGMEWRTPLFTSPTQPIPRGRSVPFATMMMVNAILGAGILSLPYAVVKGGLLLSIPFLIGVTILAYVTASWIVESQSRAQALAQLTLQTIRGGESCAEESGNESASLLPPSRNLQPPSGARGRPVSPSSRSEILDETVVSLTASRRGEGLGPFSLPPLPEDYKITDSQRVFELNELCCLFLGKHGQRVYEGSLFLYVYSTLWLYASIVANTVVSIVPLPNLTKFLQCNAYADVFPAECVAGYRIWLSILCVVLLPICFVDISALARIQVFLNALSYFCISTMMLSVAAAIFVVPASGAGSPSTAPFITIGPLVDLHGFGILFATTIFTQMGHWGVPSIIQVLGDKQRVNEVLRYSFTVTFTLYLLLSVLCVLYFGSTVLPTVTLNWREFTLIPDGSRPPWIQAISTAVVAVPVCTIMCAIPMFIHTLANNLVAAFSQETWKSLLCTKAYQDSWPPYRLQVGTRLFTLVPPFILAFVERDASAIVSLCGLFGFVLMFFIPALLQWYSIKTLTDLWPHIKGVSRTPFSGAFSNRAVVAAVFIFAFVGFIFNGSTVITHLVKG